MLKRTCDEARDGALAVHEGSPIAQLRDANLVEDEGQTDRGRLTVSQGSWSHLSATKTIQVKVKSLDLEVLAIFSCRAIGSLDGEDRSRSWWSIKVVNCHILNKMTGDLLYPGCEVLSAEGVEESDVVDVADPLGQDGVQPV